jgi:hypothetical protein
VRVERGGGKWCSAASQQLIDVVEGEVEARV